MFEFEPLYEKEKEKKEKRKKGEKEKKIIITNIILTLHPLVQSRIRTLRRQRLARQKLPILTAQTTRPLQRK